MLAEIDPQNKAFDLHPQSGLTFIEQLQISASKPCINDQTPYLVGVNENAKISLLTKASCKRWNCPSCAARNTRTWIAKIINGVNRLGGDWFFLTLTAHRKWRKERSIVCLRLGWKKFYNRILAKVEKSAKDIYYSKVWEQHTDGSFHLHLLINVCFGTRWAKDNAAGVGMGNQADWQPIDNAGQIAGYISKYSLKNADIARNGIEWPKGLRRIETSHKWPILPQKNTLENFGWIVKFDRVAQLHAAQTYFMRGFEIVDAVRKL